MQEDQRPDFELVMQEAPVAILSDTAIRNKIERAGLLFSHLRFSKIGVPPGMTEKILSEPGKYWREKIDGKRVFYIPLGPLMLIHELIAGRLKSRRGENTINFPAAAYWAGSSIIQNGRYHRRNSSSLVLDARKAFESVRAKHIYRYLLRTGTMLYGPHSANDRAQAWIISRLLTYRGRLREGSPASPFVFNLMFDRVDDALTERLRVFPAVVYTRYADDYCFSVPTAVFPREVENVAREVLREYHVVINKKKTRRSGNGVLEFPGIIIVRGKIRPPGEYIKKLALWGYRYLFQSYPEWRGHRDFVSQFGRGGVPRTLKRLL